jgi:two-component system OmpR family sensor kinase
MSVVRRWSARLPLRIKLVAAVLALAAAALVAAGAAAATSLRGYLVDRVDSQLAQAAHPFSERSPFGRETRLPGGDGDRGRLPSQFVVEFVDTTGAPTYLASQPLQEGQSPPDLPSLSLQQVVDRQGQPFTVSADGGSWRVVAMPLADGSGSVLVAQSLADVQSTVDRLVVLEVSIGVVVLVLIAGVGYLIVRRSLRPLVEVEQTAAAIADGDLSQRVPDQDPRTEVGGLTAALNGMLHQIEAAFAERAASEADARASEERMRRFVADASHELRTPLTSVRGFAELYRQRHHDPDPEDARLLRRIEDEAARMGLLVDDLLLLARLDQHRPLARERVDLLRLATDAVQDLRVVDPGRTVDLAVTGGPGVPVVVGDEARLRQVLGNLVGNARNHTPPGTPVTVRVGTRPPDAGAPGGWAVVEVADKGPGLSHEQAARVFERFYRADTSRTRASGGTGLGLSIVASLVAAHHGRVELDTAPGQGATFRVLLPLADEPGSQPPSSLVPAAGQSAP